MGLFSRPLKREKERIDFVHQAFNQFLLAMSTSTTKEHVELFRKLFYLGALSGYLAVHYELISENDEKTSMKNIHDLGDSLNQIVREFDQS